MSHPPVILETEQFEVYRERVVEWVREAEAVLNAADTELRQLRRQASVGADASL